MKTAFYGAAVLGMALCAGGMGAVIKQYGGTVPWTNPFTLLGCALGVAGLAILASPLLGWKLPYVSDYRSGLIALGVVVVAKVAVTQLHLVVSR